METLNQILNFIFETVLAEIIAIVLGVLIAQFITSRWIRWRYGNWKVIVRQLGDEVVRRDISPVKAKAILEESSDLSVFIKGIASPYAKINCDLISEGLETGLLKKDDQKRVFILDLDKNPKEADSAATPPL